MSTTNGVVDDAGSVDEAAARQRLAVVCQQIDVWEAFLGPASTPEPRSALVADDDAAHPYRVSHSAYRSIAQAVDHLRACRALLVQAEVMPTWSCLTLIRASVENAATAVWLLSPSNRNERITRALQLAWDDVVSWRDVVARMPGVVPVDIDAAKTKITTIADRRRIPNAEALRKLPGYEKRIAAVEEFLDWTGLAGGAGVEAGQWCHSRGALGYQADHRHGATRPRRGCVAHVLDRLDANPGDLF